MTKEIWKDIVGHEGRYQVSNKGRVKSLKFGKERIMKQSLNSAGYPILNLCKEGKRKTFQVHQVVAIAFLNHVPDGNKLVVDHRNNDKINNSLSNLRSKLK